MTTTISTAGKPDYLLGHSDAELRRLEEQARLLDPATDALLTLAGIWPGMRVLDLGTGAGDVALLAARRVGADGAVVGVDSAADAIALARRRADRARLGNLSFVHGDLRAADPDTLVGGPFDAVVGRLVLLYVDDPAGVVRRWARLLRPDGVYLAMEYEMAASRTLPPLDLSARALGWLMAVFRRTGHDPSLGARLPGVLTAAGLQDVCALGMQSYLSPDDPAGPRLLASTLRTLLPAIEGHGIASADEVGIDTLEQRLAQAQTDAGAIMTPPALVGAWGRPGQAV